VVNEAAHTEGWQKFVGYPGELGLAVAALGATSIVTQVILLREFLSVFYGNELVIGIIFFNWMALTGGGSYLGKYSPRIKNKMRFTLIALILMAVLPAATAFLLCYLRNIVFTVGGMIDIIQILYSSFILLAPYCVLSGFLFAYFAHTLSEASASNLITKVYSLEAAGGLVGGLLFNLVVVYLLGTFQSLTLLMFINFAVAFALSMKYRRVTAICAVLAVSAIFLTASILSRPDELTRQMLFKDQDVLYSKDTPYGSLTVTKQSGQVNFYENSVLMFSSSDEAQNEEAVHYAMVQHPRARSVLMVSGGVSGTTKEVLKYGADRIDYVEMNPWLIEAGQNYTTALADEKIRVINEDARIYIRKTKVLYDVVLVNMPDPATAQLNRFYTLEFLQDMKKILNPGAVISLSLQSSADYLSGEAREVSSVMYSTLRAVFRNVLIVPGLRDYYLASDSGLKISIARMIEQRGISNAYVNRYYIDDELLKQRSDYILSTLNQSASLNRDFRPVSYYRQVLYWLSYFQFKWWIPAVMVLVVLSFVILRLDAISLGIFTGGFSASSIEVLLLISFQIIYGFVYQLLGVIISIFMAGLAAGALYRHKIYKKTGIRGYILVQFAIGAYSVVLPLVLLFLKANPLSYGLVYAVYLLLAFSIAVLIGMEFSLAAHLKSGSVPEVASGLYGIDLIGSAAGAILVTAYLIPLAGITTVSFIVASLSFISGGISIINRGKYLPSAALKS